MRIPRFRTAAALIAIVMAWPVFAQQAPPPPGPLPLDHPKIREIFDASDKDKDGKLDFEEFKAALQAGREVLRDRRPPQTDRQQAQERLRDADSDGDGKVSLEEFKAAFPNAPIERFKELDRNADGFISKDDRPPAPPAAAAPEAGPRPGAGQRPDGQGRPPMRERLRAADRDGDGKVTLEEYKAAFPNVPVERFKALDPDGDGVVDLNNLPQRPPREGREGREGRPPREGRQPPAAQ